jgi:predicted membrane channel-forming protein YqfA (hemolysin III family)
MRQPIVTDAAGRAAATVDRDLNFPAGQGPKAYYKAPMLVEAQKINSAVYFAAAAVLIFVAAMLAGRKVQRNLKAKWIAAIFAVSMVTFGLIWVLLSALNRHEAEPRTPPDYPAPSATP